MSVSILNCIFQKFNTIPFKIVNRFAHRKVNITPVGGSFTAVYRFPHAPIGSVINKCKKLQLGVFIVSVPTSYIFSVVGLCGPQIPLVVSTVGMASTIALFSIGQLFCRLIGYAYVSRSKKQVKLAYIDFWGKRVDLICDIKDVTPLEDDPPFSIKDFLYRTVCISNYDKPFKINLTNGKILDDYLFKYAFYNVDDAGYKL